MLMSPEIAQALGWAAALVGMLSYQAKTREQVCFMLAASCLLWTVHYIGLGAMSGAIFNTIGLVRGLIAMGRSPLVRRGLLLFIPLLWLVAYLTARQPLDYVPAIAMTMSTLAQSSSRTLRLRLFMALSSPPWLAYAFVTGSQGGIANELLNMSSAGLSLFRFHFRPWLAERKARSAAL